MENNKLAIDVVEDALEKARGLKQLLEAVVCGADCCPPGREGLTVLLTASEAIVSDLEGIADFAGLDLADDNSDS